MASMDVEATAVIKKNSKNNNTKGCVKVMEKLPQHILFVLKCGIIIVRLPGASRDESLIGAVQTTGYDMIPTKPVVIVSARRWITQRLLYLRYLHQLQTESVSSEYHSFPDYRSHRAADHPQYYHLYRLVLL